VGNPRCFLNNAPARCWRTTVGGESLHIKRPMNTTTKTFTLGQVVTTRAVSDRMADDETFAKHVINGLSKHLVGDWGDVCEDDKQSNEEALKYGSRVLSSYGKDTDQHIWIITEADRSSTTVLYPSEY